MRSMLLMGILVFLALPAVTGCGGSDKTTPSASQSELEKYAAENPAPPAVEVDPNGNN